MGKARPVATNRDRKLYDCQPYLLKEVARPANKRARKLSLARSAGYPKNKEIGLALLDSYSLSQRQVSKAASRSEQPGQSQREEQRARATIRRCHWRRYNRSAW